MEPIFNFGWASVQGDHSNQERDEKKKLASNTKSEVENETGD